MVNADMVIQSMLVGHVLPWTKGIIKIFMEYPLILPLVYSIKKTLLERVPGAYGHDGTVNGLQ